MAIVIRKLRDLDLESPTAPGRQRFLSAASGLVCVGDTIYVVADDELHLGVFRNDGGEPGTLVRLFDGELPDEKRKRKKKKPDFEALARLPAQRETPFGALLALGSGSRPNRCRGALVGLDQAGRAEGVVREIDLGEMFAALAEEFGIADETGGGTLNIEGAFVAGDEFCLLQRGNKTLDRNSIVRYRLSEVLDGLGEDAMGAIAPTSIDDYIIGTVDGIPLCFTDAAVLPDGRIVFSAVAEDTDDSYEDGRSAGTALGIIEAGRLTFMQLLDPPRKVEGVHAWMNGSTIELLLVTDDDDPDIPACLLRGNLTT